VGFTIGLYYLIAAVSPVEGSFFFEFLNYMLKMFYAGMIPIPPLDGSHVLANILPDDLAMRYRSIGFMGIFVILALFNFVPGFTQVFISIISFVAKPYLSLVDVFIR